MSTRELTRAGVLARVAAGDLELAVGGGDDGRELPAGETAVSALPSGGGARPHTSHAGRRSNAARDEAEREHIVALVREKYSGPVEARFGPTLAAEHLASEDGVHVHHDTLRRWMLAAGLWSQARTRSPLSWCSSTGASTGGSKPADRRRAC